MVAGGDFLGKKRSFKNAFVQQRYEQNLEYAKSLADYLQNQEWQRFCTFTTAYELTLPSARRLMQRFQDRVQDRVFNGSPVRLFWVAEKFESKDGFHTHGLLNYPKDAENVFDILPVITESYRIVAAQNDARVNFSRYNKSRAAGMYCSKYLLKRYADYDLL